MTDSTLSAPATFDAQAAAYEAPRRRLVPCFDAFYGTAVAALELLGRPPQRVLDLGAGTGMLAARVAAAHPDAELVLTDGAPAMLEQARAALGDRARLVVADLADPLPEGPFDAVVSALAIHHLDDAGKRALFARVRAALPPGGVFVNAEQVAGPTPCFDRRYRAWHEASARALGATDAEWAGAEERMRHDRCADVESQLRWLREAGFDAADCLFKDHRFAVLVARRAHGPAAA
jgi:tRNA (cmo5U34)-methyltransferase